MKIFEDDDSCDVIIDGTRIEGYIFDEKCKKCGNFIIYYDRYDAFFCAYCNMWTNQQCGDVDCEYCKNRPEKPL